MTPGLIAAVGMIVLLVSPLLYAFRIWRPRATPAKDRLELVASFLEVATLLVIIQAVVTMSTPLAPWMWMTAVTALAFGAAGASMQWDAAPWRASTRSRWKVVTSVVGAAVCVAVLGVLA
jgi:hypothetical protein